MNKKGNSGWIILGALFILFVFAIFFLLLYPLLQGVDTTVTPLLNSDWTPLRANWMRAIWYGPAVGVILMIFYIIVSIARNKQQNDLGPQ